VIIHILVEMGFVKAQKLHRAMAYSHGWLKHLFGVSGPQTPNTFVLAIDIPP